MNRHDQETDESAVPGLGALRTERQPQRDLWPGIDARIRARRGRAWRAPLWAGAALAATLVLALGLSLRFDPRTDDAARHAPAETAASGSGTGLRANEGGDPHLLMVSNRPLHPETRALMRANLKIVSHAERDLRQALEQDPDGEYLKSLLAAAQRQKQELRVALAADR